MIDPYLVNVFPLHIIKVGGIVKASAATKTSPAFSPCPSIICLESRVALAFSLKCGCLLTTIQTLKAAIPFSTHIGHLWFMSS